MKYTPEQHLQVARLIEQKANAATDPQTKARLKELASLGRFVAKVGRNHRAKEAEGIALEAIAKARKSARGG